MMSEKTAAPNLIAALEQAITIADDMLVAAATLASEDHRHQEVALKLEHIRLEARYGPDSDQAREAEARLITHGQLRSEIDMELGRFNVRTPETAPDALVVYGRVLSAEAEPAQRLRVSAIDEKRAVVAHTATDEQGVFEMYIPLAADQSYVGNRKRAADAKAAKAESRLRLEVSDREKKTLWRDSEGFIPAPGRLLYREIRLSRKAETRSSAKPTKTKATRKKRSSR